MVKVIEYFEGEKESCNLENFFGDIAHAESFIQWRIKASCKKFKQVEPCKWYCKTTRTYIKLVRE